MLETRIELLTNRHQRGEFSCGKTPLDVFIRTQAWQHAKKGINRTYVAIRKDEVNVIGYYTIVASAIAFDEFPESLAKKLPRHPLPAILIARLAVDRPARGMKLGQILLFDGIRRAVEISLQMGVFTLHVHAIDDEATRFYRKYGFVSLPNHSRHLFLPVEKAQEEFLG